MQKFEDVEIHSDDPCVVKQAKSDSHSPNNNFEDVEFTRCKLIGTGLVTYNVEHGRAAARNVHIRECSMNSFFGLGAIFDEISVNGLLVSVSPAIFDACAFRHVTLAGKCGRFLFGRRLTHDDLERDQQFQKLNDAFYSDVDWAIDISKINAPCFEIRGSIPTRLIRRNPDEHFIMTRTVALSGDWKKYGPPGAVMIGISTFLDTGVEEDLFVAGRRSKSFKDDMEFYHRLEAKGLVS